MVRVALVSLFLTGCAAIDAIERATLPPPTDCEFYRIHDDGGMGCVSITEVPLGRREFDRRFGESVWGATERDPATGVCTIYYLGEFARRVELAHTHCGAFYDVPSLSELHAPR